jgi:tetratricopeptide (TPR) repeat protein
MPTARDLLERRVPQYLAVYLGVGWGLIEFLSFMEERYGIAKAWTDLSLLAWALLVPSVVLFTWNHGRPGRDRWTRSEVIGIPLNIVVAVFVMTTAFTTRDLSATVRTITVTDETGATSERIVAAPQHRKRLALFYFDAAAEDTAVHWLRHGVPSALGLDLAQDIFIDMRSPAEFRKQLEESGFPTGFDMPLAARRRIAEELHLPYFVSGRVASAAGGGVSVTMSVHETASGRQVGERTVTGTDVLTLVDELSVHVKQDLRVPQSRQVRDLAVVELLSENPAAVRALMDGSYAATRDDWATSERLLEKATTLDPTLGLAHYGLYRARTLRGESQSALEPLARALQYEFRMPERTRFLVKVEHFVNSRDMAKAYAVATMMTEMYPDDLQGHILRSQLELYQDRKDAAIASLQRVVELDPQQHQTRLDIARLHEAQGRFRDAVSSYSAYAEQFPQDAGVQVRLARAFQLSGMLREATSAVDRALVRDPANVEALLEQASLLRSTGEFERASRLLEQARMVARSAEDRARVLGSTQSDHLFLGRIGAAVQAGTQRLGVLAEFQPPVLVRSQQMAMLALYVRAGQQQQAERTLERLKQEMSGEIAEFWRIGQLAMGVEARDTLQIREGMEGVRGLIEAFGFRFLESDLTKAEAVLHEERGVWSDALATWTRVRELEPAQLAINRDLSRAYRMLGRHDDAMRVLEVHLRSVPFAPESNLEAARVLLARGDFAGAREHLAKAAAAWSQADPTYAPAAELRTLQAAQR